MTTLSQLLAELPLLLRAIGALELRVEPLTLWMAVALCKVIAQERAEADLHDVAAMRDALDVVSRSLRWSLSLSATRSWSS